MKPISRKAKHTIPVLQNISIGPVLAKVIGTVKKLGSKHQYATVIIYNKANLLPIKAIIPDENGNYKFNGLNTNLKTFVVAFDRNQQYNAVIQDNVVPK